MYFSWLDVDVVEIYRQECMAEAHNDRLVRSTSERDRKESNWIHKGVRRFGQWLEAIGRNLQGLNLNDPTDLSRMQPR